MSFLVHLLRHCLNICSDTLASTYKLDAIFRLLNLLKIISCIINHIISRFHNHICSLIENIVHSAICKITSENSLITLRIELLSIFHIIQNITCSPKNIKVLNKILFSFSYRVGCHICD